MLKLTAAVLIAVLAALADTPAEIAIRKAQAEIANRPNDCAPYNTLAMAYARRARESSDVQFYAKAEETLKQSGPAPWRETNS